jgi:hypothetical protein
MRRLAASWGVRPRIGTLGRKRATNRAVAPDSVKATIALARRSAATCTAALQTVAATSRSPTAGGGGLAVAASASLAMRRMVATDSTG